MKNNPFFLKQRQRLSLAFVLLLLLPFSACRQSESQGPLLKEAVSYREGSFFLPGLDWYCSEQILWNELKLSDDDVEWVDADLSCLRLKEKQCYSAPRAEASVQYLFVSNADKRLVGADYVLSSVGESRGAVLYQTLVLQAENLFGEPNGTQPPPGTENGISWSGGNHSLLSIRRDYTKEHDWVTVSIRAPKSS